jgi:uncharacterized membrane protein
MSTDSLVNDYLDRLERELADVPSARRRELVQEISEHISEARAQFDPETEADIRNLLDRLGDPADIAAEARGTDTQTDHVAAQPRRSRTFDVLALIMLLIGGLVLPVVGWLVGVVLLWVSDTWTTGEKILGTLVVPGGLAFPVFWLVLGSSAEGCGGTPNGFSSCTEESTSPFYAIIVAVFFLAPIAVTAYLARRSVRAAVPA